MTGPAIAALVGCGLGDVYRALRRIAGGPSSPGVSASAEPARDGARATPPGLRTAMARDQALQPVTVTLPFVESMAYVPFSGARRR